MKFTNLTKIFLVVILATAIFFIGLYSPVIFSYIKGFYIDFGSALSFKEIEEIRNKNLDFGELSKFFTDLANDKGRDYAYKSLAKATALNYLSPNIDTHLLGHNVGDILYKQMGIEGMKFCTQDLRNACSHSIVVGALLEFGVDKLRDIADVCRKAPGGKGAYTMCIHGLGHGVLAYTEYDMAQAIKLCEKVSEPRLKNREYGECVGGISMEMMAGVNDKEAWEKQKANYFKKDDPLAPCDMDFMPEAARPMCYNFLTPHLFEAAGASMGFPQPEYYKKAFSFCGKVADELNRDVCYAGFGKEFVVLANARNIQSVENMDNEKLKTIYQWCVAAGYKKGTTACMKSALMSLYWGGENKRDAATRFCGVISDHDDKTACFSNLIGAVFFYIDDFSYKKEFCGEIPSEFKKECESRLK